jgi:peptidyl-prolyl cis-trans isomerase B (cyclophilin B)
VRHRLIAILALGAALAAALAACGGGDAGSGAAAPATTAESAASPDGCPEVEQPPARDGGGERKPSKELDASKSWRVTVKTSCGSFAIQLDPKRAPHASASFVALARSGFFDHTYFHRIVPGFVIQGGDPTGTGSDGPGYKTVDRPPRNAAYTKGVVAMAKAGDEPAGTAGSQFFVVTGDDAGLPPDYAIIGKVVKGLDVVERIGRLGDAAERPLQVITIDGMDVSSS